MQHFLVIGSKGFIGQHFTRYLREKELSVWEADVVVDYQADEKYFLIDTSNVDFHQIFESQQFDVCINCSGAASVPDSLRNPMRDYLLNTTNVFRLLDAIRTYQPDCRFINLSSAAVYGNPSKLPVSEETSAAPVSPYGYHKAMSEQICEEFFRFFGLHTCSLRIFSAYGEGLYKQLFWDLFQKVKNDATVRLFGTGLESRDFIYIKDLVRAIHLAALHAPCEGEAINVANGKEIYIKDAVATFFGLFENPIDYQFSGEERPGDPNNWVADIRMINSIGYHQNYTLEDGLKNYYDWARRIG